MTATVFVFDKKLEEKRFDAETLKQVLSKKTNVWIDITHPTAEDVKILASLFGIHKVVCDDCLSPDTQPKIEYFGNHMHLVVSSLSEESGHLKVYEIDFIVGERYIISIHVPRLKYVDDFRKNTAQVEHELGKGAEHILHFLVDMLVENFFPILERLEDEVDALEQSVIKSGSHKDFVHRLLKVKRDILIIRKITFPQREVLSLLTHEKLPIMSKGIALYFRDDYDRMTQVHNSVEQNREIVAMVLQVQQAVTSNRLNEVVKVLTLFSSIMLPLTFIASIYGMNFRYMPELEWRYGYFLVLGVMALVATVMFLLFRKKKFI